MLDLACDEGKYLSMVTYYSVLKGYRYTRSQHYRVTRQEDYFILPKLRP